MAQGPPRVHNYGHGGSGVTLSWGCAEDTLALVRQAVEEH
jgi:D-amino-acid oxidase